MPQSPRGKTLAQIVDTENIDDPFRSTLVNGSVIVGGRALKLLSDGSVS